MKVTDITYKVSILILALYGLYVFGTQGFGMLIFMTTIALLSSLYLQRWEYVAIFVVLLGFTLTKLNDMYMTYKLEGFEQQRPGMDIPRRIAEIQKQTEPTGVYDKSVEGFQDASAPEDNSVLMPIKGDEKEKDGQSSSSTPASSQEVEKQQVDVKSVMQQKPTSEKGEGFSEKTPGMDAGLFKLGELPSELKDGPFVDAGSTLMKAMNSLDSNQIQSMTADTKKLIETQKGLMSMLQTMRPVLQDGRQLLDAFSSIFS